MSNLKTLNLDSNFLTEYAQEMESWFNLNYSKQNSTHNFSFNNDEWYLIKSYSNNTRVKYDFNFMNIKVHLRQEKLLIKCFLTSLLLDGYSERTIYSYFYVLRRILLYLTYFKNINSLSENELIYLCTSFKKNYVVVPLKYLDFILDNNFYESDKEMKELLKARNKISNIHQKQELSNSNRELPNNTDIALFQYYIHKFKSSETDRDVYNMFYPLIIWWELSIVIPLRPSEITFTMPKKCLYKNKDACYITIRRIKSGILKKMIIPVQKRLCISEELYELIDTYCKLTEYDTNSKTLFSMNFLRTSFLNIKGKDPDIQMGYNTFHRYYDNYSHFESYDLNQLINVFYDYYIDSQIDHPVYTTRLTAGDTRHIAFSSLFLQGINPIDIAMMGGHTSLISLNSYVNHVDLYIDSEIYRYYNKLDIATNGYNKKLKEIIFQMPDKSPSNIDNSIPDEYGIGYCTDPSFSCEDDLCFFCCNWWCRPSNNNYVMAIKNIVEHQISQLHDEMVSHKKILNLILSSSSITMIDQHLVLKDEYYSKYSQVMKSICSNASRMEMLKNALLINFNIERNRPNE